jgi:hypothetical protein
MLMFVAAMLIMVGDIWLVGAVGRVWILIPAMALDLLVSFRCRTRRRREKAGRSGKAREIELGNDACPAGSRAPSSRSERRCACWRPSTVGPLAAVVLAAVAGSATRAARRPPMTQR